MREVYSEVRASKSSMEQEWVERATIFGKRGGFTKDKQSDDEGGGLVQRVTRN
jgi:hypothetical protein